MTEFDQREELHAALGHKMMGSGVTGSASVSTTEGSRSSLDSPANHDKYHVAGIAAMDAYGAACMDAGKFPTRQGYLDAAVRGIAIAVIRDRPRQVVGKVFDTYIDDASGA